MESMGQMLLDNEMLKEMDMAWNMCGPPGAASFFRCLLSKKQKMLFFLSIVLPSRSERKHRYLRFDI
jgi:hypothetical protein